jgi:nucleotide-binding universal stress UspA family protein
MRTQTPVERIVVGVDGSDGSAAALRWAIGIAKRLDAEIVAVHVLELPYPVAAPIAGGALMGIGTQASFEQSLREEVKELFHSTWCAPLFESGVRYREVFGDGRAGPTLLQAAERERADLIVTGRRGLGSVTELLAGSVSQYLIHRARTPVVVIPQATEEHGS